MKKRDEANVGATIQLQLSDLQLEELQGAGPPQRTSRSLPPPLPQPFAPAAAPEVTKAPPASSSAMPPAKGTRRRLALFAGVFVVLLAGAILGGVKVGLALRPTPGATQASSAGLGGAAEPVRTSTPAMPPAASAAPGVVSIPAVDMTTDTTDPADAH